MGPVGHTRGCFCSRRGGRARDIANSRVCPPSLDRTSEMCKSFHVMRITGETLMILIIVALIVVFSTLVREERQPPTPSSPPAIAEAFEE